MFYSDIHTLGSYSHVGVEATGNCYLDLAENIDGRLFFAGEATNMCNPASMQGAYSSGLRAAYEIHMTLNRPSILQNNRQHESQAFGENLKNCVTYHTKDTAQDLRKNGEMSNFQIDTPG